MICLNLIVHWNICPYCISVHIIIGIEEVGELCFLNGVKCFHLLQFILFPISTCWKWIPNFTVNIHYLILFIDSTLFLITKWEFLERLILGCKIHGRLKPWIWCECWTEFLLLIILYDRCKWCFQSTQFLLTFLHCQSFIPNISILWWFGKNSIWFGIQGHCRFKFLLDILTRKCILKLSHSYFLIVFYYLSFKFSCFTVSLLSSNLRLPILEWDFIIWLHYTIVFI